MGKSQVLEFAKRGQESETNDYLPGESLCGWVMHEVDALLDIALQTLLAGFEKLLLVGVQLRQDVGSFLGSRGLGKVSAKTRVDLPHLRTPSSTGTEK